MSGEGWPTANDVAEVLAGQQFDSWTEKDYARHAELVVELYRLHEGMARDAADALREIARVSIPELNPDGVDQAAYSMREWAIGALEALGLEVPEQRSTREEEQG